MKTNKRKYHTKHFQNLPLDVQRRIYNLISRGKTLYQIIKLEKVSVSSLHLLFEEIQKPVSRGKIGHRNEAYHTEDEMINGYITPTYEDLSENEKLIYNLL
jgi:Fe-S cluster biosynthesis and repair protein YggX